MIINIKIKHLIQLKSVYKMTVSMFMLGCKDNYIAEEKISILLSDVSIEGDLVEKDKIILDAKVNGDVKAQEVDTRSNANIKGNITASTASLGGKHKGNVNSDKILIKKTADIDGVLNQKLYQLKKVLN